MSLADHLAILAFEAALDRNAWLWGELCRMEQEAAVDRRRDDATPISPAAARRSRGRALR